MPSHNSWLYNIDVITEDAAKIIFLKRLGGAGADPQEAALLQTIGADNEFLQLNKEEQERLKDIANEVAKIPTFCSATLILSKAS